MAIRTLWLGATDVPYQKDNIPPPAPNVSVSLHASPLDRSGLVRVMGSPFPSFGLLTGTPGGTDQLRVSGDPVIVNLPTASALSPSDLLFPFLDSGVVFASFSFLFSLFFYFASAPSLFPLLPSSVSFAPPSYVSSGGGGGGLPSVAPSLPPSSVPLFSLLSVVPSVISMSVTPPSLSAPLPPSVSAFSSVSLPGPAPLSAPSIPFSLPSVLSSSFLSSLPTPPAPLVPPSSSSSFPLGHPSATALPPLSSSSSFSFSAVSSSSSFLDFAAFQARSLGLSSEYQSLVCWYFHSGGTDFLSNVASFFPHLSADASRYFSSGSSIFLSVFRSLASAPLSAPPVSSGALVSHPAPVSLPARPLSVSAPPPLPLLPLAFSSDFPRPPVSTPFPSAPPLGSPTPFARPPLGFSAAAPSPFPSFPPSVPLPDHSLSPSAPSGLSLRPSAPAFPGFSGVAAPAVPVATPADPTAVPVAPVAPAPLFRQFAVSGSSDPPLSTSASFAASSAAPTAVPGLASGVPPVPPQAPVASATPSASAFVGSVDEHFDPGFPDVVPRDPEVPHPPSVPDSFKEEIRRMYAYLVDLFPQAAGAPVADPPPRAFFEEFYTPASAPQQPIFLNWFARVSYGFGRD